MNKLIFSEGGQPVCLDDLKTLQDMIVETIKPLLLALVKTNVFILDDYDFRNSEIDTEKMQTKFILSAGTLVVDGDFLSWPDTPLAIDDWNQPIYICVKNKEEDVRTFEDGKIEIALNPRRFMRVRIQQVLTKPIIYIICIPCWICFPLPLVLAQSRKMQKSPSLMDIRVRLKSTRQTMTDNLQSTSVHRLRVGTLLMELFQKEYSLSLMTATIVSICKERSVLHLIILERNTNLLFVQSLLLQ